MRPITDTDRAKVTPGMTKLCGACRVAKPYSQFIGQRNPAELVKLCLGCRNRMNKGQLGAQRLRTAMKTLCVTVLSRLNEAA